MYVYNGYMLDKQLVNLKCVIITDIARESQICQRFVNFVAMFIFEIFKNNAKKSFLAVVR